MGTIETKTLKRLNEAGISVNPVLEWRNGKKVITGYRAWRKGTIVAEEPSIAKLRRTCLKSNK